jgi:hypothetical protein
MGELRNRRHEAFARELARGQKPKEAYSAAGYQECRQNASRLASKDDIQRRVSEIKSQRKTDSKDGRDPETGQFLLGHKSNGRRPKGSRNKLGEEFIADLQAEWETSGPAALKRVAEMDPVQFVKVVAQILPSKIDATLTVESELFQQARSFHEAWRLARGFVGADDDKPMIELQPFEGPVDAAG